MNWTKLMSKCGAALAALFLLTTGAGALAQGHGAKPRERDAVSVVKDDVPNVEPHSKPAINDANYRIGPGDELNVNIWGDANLSRTVSVRPDGYISLPLLDDVLVSGLTPMQLRTEIATRLKKFVSDPQVTVIMTRTSVERIFILGEVPRAGAYPLLRNMTVLEAISSAGGFTAFAKRNNVYVLRTGADHMQVKLPFNYRDVIKGVHPEQNILLRTGDTIVVP